MLLEMQAFGQGPDRVLGLGFKTLKPEINRSYEAQNYQIGELAQSIQLHPNMKPMGFTFSIFLLNSEPMGHAFQK